MNNPYDLATAAPAVEFGVVGYIHNALESGRLTRHAERLRRKK
jgi:hypothetical protein